MESVKFDLAVGPRTLPGMLTVPKNAQGLVLFAHGSGSSRLSPRNQFVAQVLQGSSLATLLFDLLEEWEGDDRQKVFDIELLAERLGEAADWVRGRDDIGELRLGLFGASTGAAAALVAAARRTERMGAILSRGGRPDLAQAYLGLVKAPAGSLPVLAADADAYEVDLIRISAGNTNPLDFAGLSGYTHEDLLGGLDLGSIFGDIGGLNFGTSTNPNSQGNGEAMHPSLDALLLTKDQRELARQAIKENAYYKWQAAGCPEDDALRFWLEAEYEWVEYCYVPIRYPERF